MSVFLFKSHKNGPKKNWIFIWPVQVCIFFKFKVSMLRFLKTFENSFVCALINKFRKQKLGDGRCNYDVHYDFYQQCTTPKMPLFCAFSSYLRATDVWTSTRNAITKMNEPLWFWQLLRWKITLFPPTICKTFGVFKKSIKFFN